MDKRALALGFMVAGLCVELHQPNVGGVLFVAFIWIGTHWGKKDPHILEIGMGLPKQRGLYDPLKRTRPTVVIEREK